MMKYIISILFFSCVLSLNAQDIDDFNWLDNQRPECGVTGSDDGVSPHLAPMRVGSHSTAALKSYGHQKVPVVLVNFADRKFSVASSNDSIQKFYDLFCNGYKNGELYKKHGSYGSVRDYFVAQSDSLFLPEFTIIGPVTLDNGYATYGKNSGSSKDLGFSSFRTDAMEKATQIYTDWSDFDNDGNGTVDMVFFIYAGWGESNTSGLDPDAIWAKESPQSVTINGQVFATSAATQELRVNTSAPVYNTDSTKVIDFNGKKADGIGVMVHELSHSLGLPDFYDTKSKAFGMDLWSIMDYGNYANNGYTPGNYTAYERDFMGWQQLITLDKPAFVTLKPFAEGGCGYKIVNDANSDEYYIVENRQPVGWDCKLALIGKGMQVTHVDYNASAWTGNRVNTDETHQRMTIIPANNILNGVNTCKDFNDWAESLAGNLYPGESYNYNLTDETTPAAECYTGYYMHKPIHDITEHEDGTITFYFKTNGQLETPYVNGPKDIAIDGFTVDWDGVEYAKHYVVELYREDNTTADVPYLQQVDTLDDISIIYTNLDANRPYKVRVKAIADSQEDYLDSEWSEYISTRTLIDAIDAVPEGDKIVDVYLTNGQSIGRYPADELYRMNLHQGIYVVRYSNGSCRKILVR